MVRPTYAHIGFELNGQLLPDVACWFETTNEHEARGYVSGFNTASQMIKARLLEVRSNADRPTSSTIRKMVER